MGTFKDYTAKLKGAVGEEGTNNILPNQRPVFGGSRNCRVSTSVIPIIPPALEDLNMVLLLTLIL